MDASVYIVIPSTSVGGAEKRMLGLWRHLSDASSEVGLVAFRSLVEIARRIPELNPLPTTLHVIDDSDSWRHAIRMRVARLRASNPKAVFHYVLVSPLEIENFATLGRTLYSFPSSSLANWNWKGRLSVFSALLFAGRIDVLDRSMWHRFSLWFPWRRDRMTVTPNSYVDLSHYASRERRKLQLVFLGLFSEEKQAGRFVECVPELYAGLTARGYEVNFRMLGREIGPPLIGNACEALQSRGIPITSSFAPDVAAILGDSMVIFSLQRTNNYPSKALLEGMACGCLPVVTDVGSSEKICPREYGEYVPRDFTATDLTSACLRLLALSEAEKGARRVVMREFLAHNFSIDRMAAYYLDLYHRLIARR